MISRSQFICAARRWIGVPWVHQGRNRLGVDCVGLLFVTCWSVGLLKGDDVRGYGIAPDPDWMREQCDRLLVRADAPQIGDVILMHLTKRLLHAGIRTDHGVLHSWGGRRVCEVRMGSWRIAAAYTVPGVA